MPRRFLLQTPQRIMPLLFHGNAQAILPPRLLAFLLSAFVCFSSIAVHGQEADSVKKLVVAGYLSEMPTALVQGFNQKWLLENVVHNRLNVFAYPFSNWKASLQLRTRFISGNYFDYVPGYAQSYAGDRGFADLSCNVMEGKRYVLNTQVDRLYLEYANDRIDITAGRQRINWGQTLVWNPNDIFNSYSFFDFDYVEKPGADAVRLQYFPGTQSSLELAAKVDSSRYVTVAGLFKLNRWGYDFQLLAGMLQGHDLAVGCGWSGNIGGAAFRGEAGYYRPFRHFSDTAAIVQVSLDGDYSFANSLFLQAEILYSGDRSRKSIQSLLTYYAAPLSVKNLSFTDWNLFIQASYPLSPLLNCSLALMSFPRVSGFYLGPTLSLSLAENLNLSGVVQIFSGKFQDYTASGQSRNTFTLAFVRLKYSF